MLLSCFIWFLFIVRITTGEGGRKKKRGKKGRNEINSLSKWLLFIFISNKFWYISLSTRTAPIPYLCKYMPQCSVRHLYPCQQHPRVCQCTTEPSHSPTSALAVFKASRGRIGRMRRTGTSIQDMTRMGLCGALTHCTFSLPEKHLLRLPLSVVFPFTFINIKLWHHKNLMNINDGNCKKYFGGMFILNLKFSIRRVYQTISQVCIYVSTSPLKFVCLWFVLNTPHKSSKKIRRSVRFDGVFHSSIRWLSLELGKRISLV